MKRTAKTLMRAAISALSLIALSACSDPFAKKNAPVGGQPAPLEDCAASAEWLPNTPAVEQFTPLPHPTTECPFYRGGWQTFLQAMQPDADGTPALVHYPTIETTFTPKVPYSPDRSYLGDIKQAGRREIVIDGNGNSLYYGIHVNEAYRQFIADNDLKTSDKIQAYPSDPVKKNLFFPGGVAEFKSAWQIVEGDDATVAANTQDFISMKTTVPTLHQDPTTGAISEDRDTPIHVTVRLLAIHIVYTLPGHPEFIWASFEHTSGSPDSGAPDGKRDVAPIFADQNPTDMDPYNADISVPVSDHDFILYKAGTAVNQANASIPEVNLHLTGQKFLNLDGTPQQTSIYRMFPASKSNTIDADDAITSLNHNVEYLFNTTTLAANDKRSHYRLVGAQWMDKPDFFDVNEGLQNDETSPYAQPPSDGGIGIGAKAFLAQIAQDGSDSQYSILAGEDRMSSVAMESFTQSTGSFPNCLSCHNTQAITSNGVSLDSDHGDSAIMLLEPGLLNVSHVISQFILEDCSGNIATGNPMNPNGKRAVCATTTTTQ